MIYGYMRKSNEEGSNSSFDTQKHKIKGYCQIHNLNVDEYFEDICYGGLLLEQRQSGMLMSTKLKKGDTIICSALDRYSRSHYGLVNDVEKFRRQKIKLVFTDLGDVISSDSLGSVFYQILSIMSEWYRKSLSEKLSSMMVLAPASTACSNSAKFSTSTSTGFPGAISWARRMADEMEPQAAI